jgi:hypothetical protein
MPEQETIEKPLTLFSILLASLAYLTPVPFPKREGVPEHAISPLYLTVSVLEAKTWSCNLPPYRSSHLFEAYRNITYIDLNGHRLS